jgi:hypothetical protein
MTRTIIAMDFDYKDTWAAPNSNIFQNKGENIRVLAAAADKERYNIHPGRSAQQYQPGDIASIGPQGLVISRAHFTITTKREKCENKDCREFGASDQIQ